MNRKLTIAAAGFILASAAVFSSTVPAADSATRAAATAQRCVSPLGGKSLASTDPVSLAASTPTGSRYPRPSAAAQNDFVIKGNCTEEVLCKPVGSAGIIAHEAEEARQKRPTEELFGNLNFRH